MEAKVWSTQSCHSVGRKANHTVIGYVYINFRAEGATHWWGSSSSIDNIEIVFLSQYMHHIYSTTISTCRIMHLYTRTVPKPRLIWYACALSLSPTYWLHYFIVYGCGSRSSEWGKHQIHYGMTESFFSYSTRHSLKAILIYD